MNKKLFYAQPTAEVVVVSTVEIICGSPNGYHQGGGGSYGNEDTNDNGDF